MQDFLQRYANNPTIAMIELVSEPSPTESGYVCVNETQAAQALRSFFDTVGAEFVGFLRINSIPSAAPSLASQTGHTETIKANMHAHRTARRISRLPRVTIEHSSQCSVRWKYGKSFIIDRGLLRS